mmetsp:Transcript_29858/g.69327  ORF Transcript_29858/g.69327 Transcript_29858/m.69327 type:complete len:352 (+) Transcript_29858:3118-4173(+)
MLIYRVVLVCVECVECCLNGVLECSASKEEYLTECCIVTLVEPVPDRLASHVGITVCCIGWCEGVEELHVRYLIVVTGYKLEQVVDLVRLRILNLCQVFKLVAPLHDTSVVSADRDGNRLALHEARRAHGRRMAVEFLEHGLGVLYRVVIEPQTAIRMAGQRGADLETGMHRDQVRNIPHARVFITPRLMGATLYQPSQVEPEGGGGLLKNHRAQRIKAAYLLAARVPKLHLRSAAGRRHRARGEHFAVAPEVDLVDRSGVAAADRVAHVADGRTTTPGRTTAHSLATGRLGLDLGAHRVEGRAGEGVRVHLNGIDVEVEILARRGEELAVGRVGEGLNGLGSVLPVDYYF